MKCWRCGKEFYSEHWNQTLCDDCMGRNVVTTTFEPITKIEPSSVFVSNILLVEEGSVDKEQLEKLGIKYLIYKKGKKPEIFKPVEVKE